MAGQQVTQMNAGEGRTAAGGPADGLTFSLLGPLEIGYAGAPAPLRGVHQRAVLGYLLLHANSVVATSDLIRALWRDDPPATARKMLQNAIAAARGVLDLEPAPASVVLVTRTPGYMLQVPSERIDRWRFQQLAAAGRDLLATGDWEESAAVLREALALWRGPVLADLAESGVAWPELAAEQNSRLAALEDYAEAQLALGRHHEVIAQLEAALAGVAQPPRERLAGQLMIAFYRAGRQADALSVYRRTRTVLIEQLGLDPSRQLQELERAILAHDPGLLTAAGGPPGPATGRRTPAEPAPPPRAGQAEPRRRARPPALRLAPDLDEPDRVEQPVAERKPVTVLLLRAGVADLAEDHDPEDLQEAWQLLDETVEEVVGRYGGSVRREAVGSLWTAWFGVPRTRDDDTERAVKAAGELLGRLGRVPPAAGAVRGADDGHDAPAGLLALRAAVASGDAMVSSPPDGAGPVEVNGGVLDISLRLLSEVPAGGLRVCDTTRAVTAHAFVFSRPEATSAGWSVAQLAAGTAVEPATPLLGREEELRLLRCMLADVHRQRRAHLATVLGEPGIGKSRLIAEFRRQAGAGAPALADTRYAVVQVGNFGGERMRAVLDELDRALACPPGEPGPARCDSAAVRRFALVDDELAAGAATRRQIERLAETAPLVVVFEDVHRAEDRLLDYVEELVLHTASLPLLVIVTARPDLLERRPYWGGGTAAATTLTVDPLPDDTIRSLLTGLWEAETRCPPDPGLFHTELLARVGGVPRFAVEYVRQLRADAARRPPGGCGAADGDLTLPSAVHRLVAARLDALPAVEKALLQDAAVLGQLVCTVGVAAVSGRDPGEVAQRLRLLEAREFLRRAPGRPVTETFGQIYLFRHTAVREVAYSQLPRHARADKHHRAASWLQLRSGGSADLAAQHSDAATAARRTATSPSRRRAAVGNGPETPAGRDGQAA